MKADNYGLILPKEQALPNCVEAWAFMSIPIKMSTNQNAHSMIIFNQPQKKTSRDQKSVRFNGTDDTT